MASNARAAKEKTARSKERERKAGLEFYQAVHEYLTDWFYDLKRVKELGAWEHKFDNKIKNVDDAMLYASKMIASLKDVYTVLYLPEEVAYMQNASAGSFAGIGAELRARAGTLDISAVTAGGPADKAGLRRRDVIKSINGHTINGMYMSDVRAQMRGPVGSTCRLTVVRSNGEHVLHIVRERIIPTDVTSQILPNNIGYLRIESLNRSNTADMVRKELKGKLSKCSGIVLDLRDNGGGDKDVFEGIVGLLLKQGKITKYKARMPGYPLHLELTQTLTPDGFFTDGEEGGKSRSSRRKCVLDERTPLVVLTDKDTASYAELLTAVLKQNGRAVSIGERTWGKAISQAEHEMPYGTALTITMSTFTTPNGQWFGDGDKVRYGLKPTHKVSGNGRIFKSSLAQDKQLQAACRKIQKLNASSKT